MILLNTFHTTHADTMVADNSDFRHLPTTEIRPAAEWTCDTCGQDNFLRVPQVDPSPDDMQSMRRQFELSIEYVEGSLTSDMVDDIMSSISLQAFPKHVTCKHCNASFRTAADWLPQ